MVSLVDEGCLSITLEGPREKGRPRWRIVFDGFVPGYRNLLEEFRLELWEHLELTHQRCGNTFTVTNSPWIVYLREKEGVFDSVYSEIDHYVVLTEDDVIEVLSPTKPKIDNLGSAPANAKPAGKSNVLYHPEDRDKIEERLRSWKRKDNT